jgi:dihydrofolate reductase
MLSLIAAMARNRVIGRDGDLPWRLPEDLRHFRALTLGKPVIMGRKTCESLGRALPQRRNLVITRQEAYQAPEGFTTCSSLEEALSLCADAPEIMVIGGAEVYAQALERADRIYLTVIDHDFDGDAKFPVLGDEWHEVERSERQDAEWPYRFTVLERQPATRSQDPVLRSSRA